MKPPIDADERRYDVGIPNKSAFICVHRRFPILDVEFAVRLLAPNSQQISLKIKFSPLERPMRRSRQGVTIALTFLNPSFRDLRVLAWRVPTNTFLKMKR